MQYNLLHVSLPRSWEPCLCLPLSYGLTSSCSHKNQFLLISSLDFTFCTLHTEVSVAFSTWSCWQQKWASWQQEHCLNKSNEWHKTLLLWTKNHTWKEDWEQSGRWQNPTTSLRMLLECKRNWITNSMIQIVYQREISPKKILNSSTICEMEMNFISVLGRGETSWNTSPTSRLWPWLEMWTHWREFREQQNEHEDQEMRKSSEQWVCLI